MKEIKDFENIENELFNIAECPNFSDEMRNNAEALCYYIKNNKLVTTERKIECLAMNIVNVINESTGASVKQRQETNDANFDFVIGCIDNVIKGEII